MGTHDHLTFLNIQHLIPGSELEAPLNGYKYIISLRVLVPDEIPPIENTTSNRLIRFTFFLILLHGNPTLESIPQPIIQILSGNLFQKR
jgi:hypothetical protein